MLFASVFPELLSGNTPPVAFTQPNNWLLFLLGYGFPILAIREIAQRFRLGISGMLFLGLAYGILNEGLIAKTIVNTDHLPIPVFEHYGSIIGIVVPWGVAICLWHSFASVLFPIVFTYGCISQAERDRAWLKGWLAWTLLLVPLLLGVVAFLATKTPAGSFAQLLCLTAAMAGCCTLARHRPGRLPGPETGRRRLKPFLMGLSTLIFLALLCIVANAKLPLAVFFAVVAGGVGAYLAIARRKPWSAWQEYLWFGIGFYTQLTAVTILSHLG